MQPWHVKSRGIYGDFFLDSPFIKRKKKKKEMGNVSTPNFDSLCTKIKVACLTALFSWLKLPFSDADFPFAPGGVSSILCDRMNLGGRIFVPVNSQTEQNTKYSLRKRESNRRGPARSENGANAPLLGVSKHGVYVHAGNVKNSGLSNRHPNFTYL